MKTLKKLVLSLLIAVGVSNANLHSMINSDGIFDYAYTNYGLYITAENIKATGKFNILRNGAVAYKNNKLVSDLKAVILEVQYFLANQKSSLPTLTTDTDLQKLDRLIKDQEQLEKEGPQWGFKEKMRGRYYDVTDEAIQTFNRGKEFLEGRYEFPVSLWDKDVNLTALKGLFDSKGVNYAIKGLKGSYVMITGISIILYRTARTYTMNPALEALFIASDLGIISYNTIRNIIGSDAFVKLLKDVNDRVVSIFNYDTKVALIHAIEYNKADLD